MDKYIKAVKENVCSICADSDDQGQCMLGDSDICAVEMYLPLIVEIVHEHETDDIHYYYEQLKKRICTHCRAREENGYCYLKRDANCALDRYFLLIINTIKRVDS